MTTSPIHATRVIAEYSGRALAVAQAKIDSHASGKLAQMAEEQSLRVIAAAQSDLAQAAIERWLTLIYDQSGGVWWNVRDDHMIMLAPPWSRSRRTSYGLSEPQTRLLCIIVHDLCSNLPERRQLYWYSKPHQRWFISRRFYPTLDDAIGWQRTTGCITPVLWYGFGRRYPGGRRNLKSIGGAGHD